MTAPVRRPELRAAIADAVADLKSYEVASYCTDRLGLPGPRDDFDDPFRGKAAYVRDKLGHLDLAQLAAVGQKVAEDYDHPELETLLKRLGSRGVQGELQNLIFAPTGPKPEIVLRDATANVVEITKNAEHCLVYNRPLEEHGLTWRELVGWWADGQGQRLQSELDERAAAKALYSRLSESCNDAELVVLLSHARRCRDLGFDLPALIPQVYLHFDPLTMRQRGGPGPLPRQRMDFLMLLPHRHRVVIEVDGKQHYSDATGHADPVRYAEMVREDRALRLDGYEVYRFGGAELVDRATAASMLSKFFDSLLDRYQIPNGGSGSA